MSGPAQTDVRNLLLRSMAPDDYARLRPDLLPFPVPQGHLLIERDRPITSCFFFESGLGSVLAVSPDGEAVEMGLYGVDGFGGIPVLLRSGQSPHRLVMQIGGQAFRIETERLQAAAGESADLESLLLNYVQFFLIQTAQTCLSNALHPVQQRLARWLLMSLDRMPDENVPLTHEYLALMLTATRATVTAALGDLADQGLITTRRGRVQVLDRVGLERWAGDGYGLPEREFERLIGLPIRKPAPR